jgi:hypothetical protein
VEGGAVLELDYFLYNCSTTMREHEDRGTLRVPAILQVAWHYRDASAAWILLNLGQEEQRAQLTIESPRLGTAPRSRCTLTAHEEGKPAQSLGLLDEPRAVTISLPPRTPILIEALPVTADIRG